MISGVHWTRDVSSELPPDTSEISKFPFLSSFPTPRHFFRLGCHRSMQTYILGSIKVLWAMLNTLLPDYEFGSVSMSTSSRNACSHLIASFVSSAASTSLTLDSSELLFPPLQVGTETWSERPPKGSAIQKESTVIYEQLPSCHSIPTKFQLG